ncbi:cytochrome b/b6 domain-containing protein [Roseovarius rhodophyticola]|uniref:Cytochrome b/b6 domain-containing protein n=1 Tax=Roseovarius rhodophyticola TaxID=3080827 RepID=A0ABZ2TKV9_9RHOB|nr:cytochrome b/b6 domain-containing protein [Roseovarius sp. W115]
MYTTKIDGTPIMPMTNSNTTYGAITKSFHWLTALLILSVIPLGIFANDLAYAIKDPDVATTDADISRAAFLFSLHKTIGVTIFFVALLRILWAVSQKKPGLLNGDNTLEATAAETVHWLLYGSLVLVPLTGWIHHAATTGFAPIWWPFGQSLPFVPKDEALAHQMAGLHYILQWVLVGSVALHIAGALKHHVIDGDATLRRMLPGRMSAEPTTEQPGHALPFMAALIVWGVALGTGSALGWLKPHEAHVETAAPAVEKTQTAETAEPVVAAGDNQWIVETGTLSIAVTQLGSEIKGSFATWNADITYSETADNDGVYGTVQVSVDIASLTLGSVTSNATGADFLDAANHPTALFEAQIIEGETGLVAQGTLTIKGAEVPVAIPFELAITDGLADAQGQLTVDRRDFGVGGSDEGNVGASVVISFELTARKG